MSLPMNSTWRDRLQSAFDATGESMRSISLRAGVSHGYLYTILVDGKEPNITNMMKLADALGVTLSWIMYGYSMGPQEEELLRLYARLPEKQRQAILDLASGWQKDCRCSSRATLRHASASHSSMKSRQTAMRLLPQTSSHPSNPHAVLMSKVHYVMQILQYCDFYVKRVLRMIEIIFIHAR